VGKLDYSTIAFQFLPETFTLGELQRVYEILVDAEIDKRNFRKWALALEQIEATGELRRRGNHRPARVYRLTEARARDLPEMTAAPAADPASPHRRRP
jgi:8-oxo-dGTP diphosphatase